MPETTPNPSSPPSWQTRVGQVLDSPYTLIIALACLAILNYALRRNMSYQELDSLLAAKRFADPDFIPGDWSLSVPDGPRKPYQVLLFPFTYFLPLVDVSIIARALNYSFACVGLGLIARRLGMNVFGACAALGAFLYLGQEFLPNADEIFSRAEAGPIAYGFLFLALYALMRGRVVLAGALAGCATTMHILVGGWGSMALGLTVLSLGLGTRRTRGLALASWAVFGSYAIYCALGVLTESHAGLAFDPTYIYVMFRNPHHLYPPLWLSRTSAGYLLAVLLSLWIFIRVKHYYGDSPEALIAARFALWTLVPYGLGFLVLPFDFGLKLYSYYPFRVASTVIPLLGFLMAVPVFLKARRALPAVATAFFFWSFGGNFVDHREELARFPDGGVHSSRTAPAMYETCEWVRNNTEPGAVFLAPPSEDTFTYLCERGVPVRFRNIPMGEIEIVEWYQRLVDMNGGWEPEKIGYSGGREIGDHFNQLRARKYRRLGKKYGADYLLIRTRDQLALPLLYGNERWSVYRIE